MTDNGAGWSFSLWKLFDSSDFVTRWNCGQGWDPYLAWSSQIQDLVFAVSYFFIALGLLPLWKFRRTQTDQPAPHMAFWFALFILLCSATHLCGFLAFHWPAYRLFVAVGNFGAAVSAYTALRMPVWVRRIIRTPTAQQVLTEMNLGRDSTAELLEENKQLKDKIEWAEKAAHSEKNHRRRAMKIIQGMIDSHETLTTETLARAVEKLKQIPDSDELRKIDNSAGN